MLNTFKEEQKFRQVWLWGIILGLPILLSLFVLSEHFGDHPMSTDELIFSLIIAWASVLLFWILSLRTKIDRDAVVIQFFPFRKKRIGWDEVESAEVLNYGFVGGYGIRMWTRYGTVYNVSGHMGLALRLMNGKKVCIGTQRAEELEKFLTGLDLKMDRV